MEGYEQITLEQWMRWKEDIREKLRETAGNFVHIGYRLKQIRDSGMYDGAADIFEFARKEYGLGESTVSRFIAINEKFSEDGDSLELKEEYRTIGSSKLSEMLTLTDEECRLITEKTTVSQIRELKRFVRQGPEEREEPEGGDVEERLRSPLQRCIIEYFRGKRDMLDAAIRCIAEDDYRGVAEAVSPNGSTTFKKGILFLFMYDYKAGVRYKSFGSEDIALMSWEDFGREISEVFMPAYSAGESTYDRFYGAEEEEPEKETEKVERMPERRNGTDLVATSQQKEGTGEDDVEEMEDGDAPEGGDEEDVREPGEPAGEAEPGDDEDGAGGEAGDTAAEHMEVGDLIGKAVRNYRGEIERDMKAMKDKYDRQDWRGVIRKAKDIIKNAERIRRF